MFLQEHFLTAEDENVNVLGGIQVRLLSVPSNHVLVCETAFLDSAFAALRIFFVLFCLITYDSHTPFVNLFCGMQSGMVVELCLDMNVDVNVEAVLTRPHSTLCRPKWKR